MSITDPNFKLTEREHKGKVARTHKSNTTDCKLSRSQFERLPKREQVNVYFQTDISVLAQARFFADAKLALRMFAETLSAR